MRRSAGCSLTLDELGERDDTVVVLVSDNGASGEGGPHGSVSEFRFRPGSRNEDVELNLAKIDELGGHRTYHHYPWGWAEAGNTPVRRFKRYTFEGGVRDPVHHLVDRGRRCRAGEIRNQYCHAIDVAADAARPLGGGGARTELAGVPNRCRSTACHCARMLGAAGLGPDPRTSQYYECWGSRAMYEDGWKVVTNHVNQLTHAERELIAGSQRLRGLDHWHLFDARSDLAENFDPLGGASRDP